MQVKVKAKYIRISPRKARLVADVVRGLDVDLAFGKLAMINKKAVKFIEKLLKSAIASAEHDYELERSNLYIKEIRVDEGPTLYRWMPRAFGRASQLRKKTSMFTMIVDERVPSKKKATKKKTDIETIKMDEKTASAPEGTNVDTTKKVNKDTAAVEDHQEDKNDTKRKGGGGRGTQQRDKQTQTDKGLFKKMFRRKSGM
jgi:large subunit ribosomal protein L22